MPDPSEMLRVNQAAFDAALDDLLRDHPGRIAVFANGELWEIFDDYSEAYRAAVQEFGSEGGFVVSQIKRRTPEPVSFSLEANILFGEV